MKYTWRGTYEERHIPKQAGFRWDPNLKEWWTDDTSRALKIRSHLSEDQREELDREMALKLESMKASYATDADVKIPVPDGLEYLPYQKAGIAFAAEHENTLIADEMGLGKTIQAIGVINKLPEIKTVLVVCPASLKLNWKREMEKWLVRDFSIAVINKDWEPADIKIINYDILSKFADRLKEQTWDLMILDEAHYLKNPKAIRSKQIWGGKGVEPVKARRTIALTGTPILNRPIEMWPMLKHFAVFSSWYQYATRYCAGTKTRWGWDVSGASNLGELQEKLRSECMVRRLKSDVLKDLPPKRRGLIVLEQNGFAEIVRKTNEAEAEAEETVQAAKDRADAFEGDDEAYRDAVEELRAAKNLQFETMARAAHDIAVAKAPYAVEHVKDLLESTEKVVVFFHHKDVSDVLDAGLSNYNPVMIRGDVSAEERDAAVQAFQNNPGCRVFLGSIKAAGVGLTLTASSTVVFVEQDWVPGNMTQAEDRCHRIGQTDTVLVQHIVVDGSIDQRKAQTLIDKQDVIDRSLNGRTEMALVQEMDVQAHKGVPENKRPETGLKTRQEEKKRKIEELAASLTPEQISEIHEKLKIVASMDLDHANIVNGVGFSKTDGQFGHALADKENLTPKQAAYGFGLARKYRRQCGELSWIN